MIHDPTKAYSKILRLLIDDPETRDCDLVLMTRIWEKERNPSIDFLQQLKEKNVTHPETIRRVRQKIQECHPELRGNKYEARQKHKKMYEQLSFLEQLAI